MAQISNGHLPTVDSTRITVPVIAGTNRLEPRLRQHTTRSTRGHPTVVDLLLRPTPVRARFRLSPSDLTFLWEECPKCFYEKYHRLGSRPRIPFPSVFTRIDNAMRAYFVGKSTAEVSPLLPPGHLTCEETFIVSHDIIVPGREATCYIAGKTDCLAHFTTGGYGIVDFKTTEHKDARLALYRRQLAAYAYCLEHPAPHSLHLSPVTHLGLLCVEPRQMLTIVGNRRNYLFMGAPAWKPCSIAESEFVEFIGQVLDVLMLPVAPTANAACPFCAYRVGSGRA